MNQCGMHPEVTLDEEGFCWKCLEGKNNKK
jgi:hypothetical protein